MSRCPDYDYLLILPRLRVQAANAISSSLTHGFPSITAFTGLMWALQRKVAGAGIFNLKFRAIGVVCHQYQEFVGDEIVFTGKGNKNFDFQKIFSLSKNPPQSKDEFDSYKKKNNLPFNEEGRIHLEISLVLAVESAELGLDEAADQALAEQIAQMLQTMRIAGGVLLPAKRYTAPYWVAMTGDAAGRQALFEHLRLRLLPGFALVARDDLLAETLTTFQKENPEATVLDAWLSRSRLNWRYDNEEGRWQHDRPKGSGWVVPIPVGYAALTDIQAPGTVANARDESTPFQFVESLYSLGEWVSPHRLQKAEQLLWYADSQPEQGLYRCRNDYRCVDDSDDEFYSIFD